MEGRQVEALNADRIKIWPMLTGGIATYCAMFMYIAVAFSDHLLDLWFYITSMTVACTFFPLPTPPIVLDYGARYDASLIALLGGVAFCVSALIDYSLVTAAFRSDKIAKLKTTLTYSYVERIFHKCPFVILTTAAFTPIPLEPVKLIACASRYNRAKFFLACFIGRTPRYYLLAWLQKEFLHIPSIYLYGSIAVLVAVEMIRWLLKRSRSK